MVSQKLSWSEDEILKKHISILKKKKVPEVIAVKH